MDNEYQFDNLPEKAFPSNLDITQAVTFGSTYKYKNLKLSAGLNWHTGRPTTRPVAGAEIENDVINYQATNSSRLTNYLRVDASALYEFKVGKAVGNVGVSLWNILNEQNALSNFYRINDANVAEEFLQTSLDLTPNVLLRFYF